MATNIESLKESYEKKLLIFSESFYNSKDGKTFMGEIAFNQILFLEYRDTEAGSNPREYSGLKKVNKLILKSLLKDSINMFRFLHSGVIVCITNPMNINKNTIQYDYCCLTNGNQTRFLILIITLLKLFFNNKPVSTITKKEYDQFIKISFDKSDTIKSVLNYIKFKYVVEIVNFLNSEHKYETIFNSMVIDDFLSSKIRIQINSINSIISELENDDLNEYGAGTLIAEANNATQNVKPDDLFGNKNKKELAQYIFKDFNKKHSDKVSVEYRYGEILSKSSNEKVHILYLLRPIISTGILTKDKDIYKYTNQRAPIYSIFEKLLKKISTNQKTINAISKLIPLLYQIRIDYVIPTLEEHKRELIRTYKLKVASGDYETFHADLKDELRKAGSNDELIEKIIKRNINYNIEHIMPVLVYRIRKLINENKNQEVTLVVDDKNLSVLLTRLIKSIYESYAKMRLSGLSSSLTTEVRNSKFYEFGTETYNTLKDINKLKEFDFIEQNRYILN